MVKPGIIIEPPKGRPSEDHEARSGLALPLELSDCSVVIRRRSPVLSVPFQERDGMAPFSDNAASPLFLIDQDERVPSRNQPCDLAYGDAHTLHPPVICAELGARWGGDPEPDAPQQVPNQASKCPQAQSTIILLTSIRKTKQ